MVAPAYQTSNLPKEQSINSVEARKQLLQKSLKNGSHYFRINPNEQYEFAVSFMKIGDYETAEFALKEFTDKNKDHNLAVALSIGMEIFLELDNYIPMLLPILMDIKIIQSNKG